MSNAMNAVSAARRALVLDQPFFGVLSLKLELVEDSSSSTKTMKTDGKRLWFNPKFVGSITKHELVGVVAHEVLHCTNGHVWRREHRDARLWNEAADYAINPIVLDAGMQLPKNALIDFSYKGKSPEEIYEILRQQQQGQGQQQQGQGQQQQGQGQQQQQQGQSQEEGDEEEDFGCGQVIDCDEESSAETKTEWSAAVLNAAKQAQAFGKLPAGMERLVEEIKNPPQDWRSILRRFIQETSKCDYSWKMPNQRFLHTGLYLPSLRSETMPPIVIAIDTSGSVSSQMINQFSQEINAIANEMQPETIYIIYCDAKIHGVDVFERGEPITIKPKGFGGTDFRPVFKWVEEEGIDIACLVYLTDMAGAFPKYEPNYPVLWGDTYGYFPQPWGEKIKIHIS